MLAAARPLRRDRGSVMLLVPAGVLLVIILAAITVDFSHLYLERRELQSAAAAAANDAAVAAIDIDRIRAGDDPAEAIDFAAANQIAQISVAAQDVAGSVSVALVSDGSGRVGVEVTITRVVDYIFAPAVPGGPASKAVTGRAVAYAEVG
ncbi:MAG: pilus assembly protein TadG-related protein [Acidimicrobiia bacterium]|nr:pilus assembly protein TadG-related protein [Acidimicrobiia bacterium]